MNIPALNPTIRFSVKFQTYIPNINKHVLVPLIYSYFSSTRPTIGLQRLVFPPTPKTRFAIFLDVNFFDIEFRFQLTTSFISISHLITIISSHFRLSFLLFLRTQCYDIGKSVRA